MYKYSNIDYNAISRAMNRCTQDVIVITIIEGGLPSIEKDIVCVRRVSGREFKKQREDSIIFGAFRERPCAKSTPNLKK